MNSIFCHLCKEYNCLKHTVKGKTNKLNKLLDHFQEPEEEMRTFIAPEKERRANHQLPVSNHFDRKDPTMGGITSAKSLVPTDVSGNRLVSEPAIIPMKRSSDLNPTSLGEVEEKVRIATEEECEYYNHFYTAQSHKALPPASTHSSDGVDKFVGSKYKSHSRHHYSTINNVSFVSCTTPCRNYSETSIFLWVDSKLYGKSSSYSQDRYRIIISLMYDAEDDLWSISGRLLKRSGYLAREDDELVVPNRLCTTQELRSEIKQIVLYMGASPRLAYRLMRKAMNGSMLLTEADDYSALESEEHAGLVKAFDSNTTYSSSTSPTQNSSSKSGGFTTRDDWDDHGHYGSAGYAHPGHLQNRDNHAQWSDMMLDGYLSER